MNKAKASILLFLSIVLAMLALPAQAQSLKTTPADDYFRRALDPFWRTTEMHESALFLQTAAPDDKSHGAVKESWPHARLLFLPNKVLRVTSLSHEVTYEQGRDYLVDEQTGTLYLPPSSRIPFKTLDQLYPLLTSPEPKIPRKVGDPTRGILWQEGPFYHSMQVEITYTVTP